MATTYPTVPGVTFKDVVGFPGYCVGDYGWVWSCWKLQHNGRYGNSSCLSDTWKQLKPSISGKNGKGYMFVGLYKNGKCHLVSVHKIVLEAFIGPCPPGLQCCHGLLGKFDNRVSNLRWDTSLANHNDRRLEGTISRGDKSVRSKLTMDQVREIRSRRSNGETSASISKDFPFVASRTIRSASSGETYKEFDELLKG